MAEPMPPKHRVSLTEILTVDDLINLISMKAHTRAGRIVTGVSSIALLAAIIVGPIVIRSNHGGAGPSSTPTIPVVTVPPSTNSPTAFIQVPPPVDTAVGDRTRYGELPSSQTPTTAPAPQTTAAPPPTAAPTVVTTPATLPQPTPTPATTPAPIPFTQTTNPPPPPPPPPTTAPPLTVPPGPITAG